MEKSCCAYFKNGMLYDVFPRKNAISLYEDREMAYHASRYISDGTQYDLSTIDGINALPVPPFSSTSDILEMSYVFKIHCGCISDPCLIPAAVEKAIQLMQASYFSWGQRDYLQVVRNYYRTGLFADGAIYEDHLRQTAPAIFSCPLDERYELEHERTKQYFMRKWEKRHK